MRKDNQVHVPFYLEISQENQIILIPKFSKSKRNLENKERGSCVHTKFSSFSYTFSIRNFYIAILLSKSPSILMFLSTSIRNYSNYFLDYIIMHVNKCFCSLFCSN
uniref:Uncharacterized protein n=1 Tax=Cacopsylla melanoneura TaxID=428564 RepID=A0A8D8PZE6_9HEMI